MDLDQLANLGDFIGGIGSAIGAIAVMATLIYLAVQVRHSARAASVASFRSAKINFNQINSSLATTPGLAEVWIGGVANRSALNPGDQLRFDALSSCYFNLFETLFKESRDGIAGEQWTVEERDVRLLLSMPGVREWWQTNLISFSDAFRNHVDRLLEETPAQVGPSGQGLSASSERGEGGEPSA